MGGFSRGSSSGNSGPAGRTSSGSYGTARDARRTSRRNEGRKAVSQVADFIKGGGVTGAILRGLTKTFDPKKNRKSKSGDVYGYDEAKEKIDYKAPPTMNTGGGGDNNPQGIELAKASTTSATILGPAEIQKEAANEIKGPTSVEMSAPSTALTADQILLASKRRGRRTTNMTAKKTLDKNYTLSKKTLLGG
tara:strand:- start:170 stop:745 length:576 start_codon:yes stop_codon:yes gene_type:complete